MITEREAARSVDRPHPSDNEIPDLEMKRIDAIQAVHRYRAEKRKVNHERPR